MSIRYISTRGKSPARRFCEVAREGLAPDGGLYVPDSIPDMREDLPGLLGLPWCELACRVMHPFAEDLSGSDLQRLVRQAATTFANPCVAPLVNIGPCKVLELFHGPTLAFKDVALQFLGGLFEMLLDRDGGRLTVLGATSGDTGSAAIAALRGRRHISVTILHPAGRTSDLQRRQMTTVHDSNVHNLAVQGSFDDCQAAVKTLMGDLEFKEAMALGAVNSVNFARILAQVVYYFSAWSQLGGKPCTFVVPTGNFGDMYAGYISWRMGLPIKRLVLASNENDILPQFFSKGVYARGAVRQTPSPSMDIQVASNFERYLFHIVGPDETGRLMREFSASRMIRLENPDPAGIFLSAACSNEETGRAIRTAYERSGGYVLDPHTVTAWHAAQKHGLLGDDCILLATAHPAKFPETVADVLDGVCPRHPALERLAGLPEYYECIPNDVHRLRELVTAYAVS